MQVELSAEELEIITNCMEACDAYDTELFERLQEAERESRELDGLDLNDCGDACKL